MENNYKKAIDEATKEIDRVIIKTKELEDCFKRIAVLKKEIFNCKEE